MALLEWKCTSLYLADIQLLKPPNWFNDNIINFCCDFFQNVLFTEANFKFVHPGTTFIISHENDMDDLGDTVEGSGITPQKSHIFFPVNDSRNMTKSGGCHWSLLVFESKSQKFFCLDSMSGGNNASARKLANKVAPFLLSRPDEAKKELSDKEFVIVSSPQQENMYDCGCYTVMNMRVLAQSLGKSGQLSDAKTMDNLLRCVTPESVNQERSEIRKRIEEVKQTLTQK